MTEDDTDAREDGYSAGVRAALEKLADEWTHGWAKESRGDTIRAVERIAKAALALLDAPAIPDARAGAGAVEPVARRVKPLEWRNVRGDGTLAAFTDFGTVYTASERGWGFRNCPDATLVSGGIEAAKAAAQADYEARVRSALEPTPAGTATDGPASACVYRAPGLGTAADWERG